MTRMNPREVIDNTLLMSLVAADYKRQPDNPIYDRLKAAMPADDHYEVKISINGVELDFRDFDRRLDREFDRLVAERASDLYKELIDNELTDKIRELSDAATELRDGIRLKAIELLGHNPWQP